MDEFGTAYIKLAHEINKYIDGYVDSYYGPKAIIEEVITAEKKSTQVLLDDHKKLQELLPSEDKQRWRYLNATLNAMDCTLRKLNGQEYEYITEVESLYGISPELVEESELNQAHRVLDSVLPGNAPLPDRIKKWRNDYALSPNNITRTSKLILNKVRQLTQQLDLLIENESVTIDYVHTKPWSANCVYQGTAHSFIEINLERDWDPLSLTVMLAHEAYPGHHTEKQIKEKYLYDQLGYLEETCILLQSPEAVIAEGIATTAFEILAPDLELFDWIARNLILEQNLTTMTPLELQQMYAAQIKLFNVGRNAAILFHTGHNDQKQTLDYLETYGLMDRNQAGQRFRFFTHPLYGTYVFNYTEGYRLIDNAAIGGDKFPIFKRLLFEHVLPADLLS
jgi:hypothetical protein